MTRKPLGGRSYGSIAHLPGSRRGPADHGLTEDQARMLIARTKHPHDRVYVQEKLDGSNVAAAHIDGEILALTRAGYLATTSPYPMHHAWARWVEDHAAMLRALLQPGERACGEWLMVAHGTRYALPHGPFVLFDLRIGHGRARVAEVMQRAEAVGLPVPRLIHEGPAVSVADVLAALEPSGHGALDPVEGAVWRCERHDPKLPTVLGKYVCPEKEDGRYLAREAGIGDVLNTWMGGWTWAPTSTT